LATIKNKGRFLRDCHARNSTEWKNAIKKGLLGQIGSDQRDKGGRPQRDQNPLDGWTPAI
jgi:hypothetical protein